MYIGWNGSLVGLAIIYFLSPCIIQNGSHDVNTLKLSIQIKTCFIYTCVNVYTIQNQRNINNYGPSMDPWG